MKILIDGWSIFILFKAEIFVFFLAVFGLGSWGTDYFFKTSQLDHRLRFLTNLSLGTVLLTWSSLIFMILGRIWLPIMTLAGLALPVFSAAYLVWKLLKPDKSPLNGSNMRFDTGIGLILFALLLLRLAFLKDVLLPPYDDSPDHYMIVNNILDPGALGSAFLPSLGSGTGNYYHVGFHSIAAWLAIASGSGAPLTMSLLGQIFISMAPMAIFYLILVLTGNLPAGLTAAVFAAFAWKMPGFAANWGKYPAITGLVLLPAWLGLIVVSRPVSIRKIITIVIPLAVILGLSMIHTRLIICLIIIGVAYSMSSRLNFSALPVVLRLIVSMGLTILISWLFIKSIHIFYSGNYYLAFWVVVVLSPFAYLKHPKLMVAIALSMLGVWFAASLPVFFGLYTTNWLDPPFVEILLFIPYCLMAGLGYSGLMNALERQLKARKYALVIPLAILISGFTSPASLYPDPCCNYVAQGDLGALDWIRENSATDSVVWVAGFRPQNYMIGTDAGVWVFALSGRNTNKLRYDFDWESPSARSQICKPGYRDVYIYEGGGNYSFDSRRLSRVTWLSLVYAISNTKVYRTSCPLVPSTHSH